MAVTHKVARWLLMTRGRTENKSTTHKGVTTTAQEKHSCTTIYIWTNKNSNRSQHTRTQEDLNEQEQNWTHMKEFNLQRQIWLCQTPPTVVPLSVIRRGRRHRTHRRRVLPSRGVGPWGEGRVLQGTRRGRRGCVQRNTPASSWGWGDADEVTAKK